MNDYPASRKPSRKAKGTITPEGQHQISIRFDAKIFKKILRVAEENDRTFAAQVLIYVGRGMDRSA